MKLIALADLHCRFDSFHLISDLFGNGLDGADALLLPGDLTNRGLPEEAACLGEQLSKLGLPVIAVLGNHDFESGKVEEVKHILGNAGVTLLQGSSVVLPGDIGIVGIKGFCGGFDDDQLGFFGEPEMKDFVQVCIDEANALEKCLLATHCAYKLAMMHYSPTRSTLRGEAPEGYIFQGATRLGEAAERGGANMILHGHSHFGSPFGVTAKGIPVNNVCRYVLSNHCGQAYRVIEI
jgi:Icc-related predicted phosphoesterase